MTKKTILSVLEEETEKLEEIETASSSKEEFERKIYEARKAYTRIMALEEISCIRYGNRYGEHSLRAQKVLNELRRLRPRAVSGCGSANITGQIRPVNGIIYGRKLA